MAYVFQSFTINAVLTAAQMNQTEVNVRDHIHGLSGVSTPVLLRINSPVSVANTTTETDLINGTIPGGKLGTNRFLRWKAWGKLLNDSGGTVTYTIRGYYGASTYGNVQRVQSTGAGYASWEQEGVLIAAGATNSQRAFQKTRFLGAGQGVDADFSGTPSMFQRTLTTAITIDSTANKTYKLTVQMDTAHASAVFVLEGFYIEEVG